MHNDESFLRAILADPSDDAPWLIYADWLEERGDPRAALYRIPRWTNALGMGFVLVPRGSFWMGERGNQRQVEVAHEFYMGAFPVTQGQWQEVMRFNHSYFSRGGDGARRVRAITNANLKQLPVEQVSWDDAQEFVKRLNTREGESGLLYRLPNEREWEYSCRGAASSQEECGFDFYLLRPTNDLSSKQANFNGGYPAGTAPKGKDLRRTTKVGSYQPNCLGLYDMHGNVWEWCEDQFEAGDVARAMRGGCWADAAGHCRASDRNRGVSSGQYSGVGFRVAAAPSGA